jgi:uncharacterized membrane protein YkgB
MSLEQAAIAVVIALASVISFLYLRNESSRNAEINLLKQSSDECQKWRAEKEPLIHRMAQELGIAEGVVTIINACKIKGCPHAGNLDKTFSINPTKNTHEN